LQEPLGKVGLTALPQFSLPVHAAVGHGDSQQSPRAPGHHAAMRWKMRHLRTLEAIMRRRAIHVVSGTDDDFVLGTL
jgi:hypothetical protein